MGITELAKKISKSAKGVHVSILSESEIAKRNIWVSTPSYDLNRIITGDLFKGLPEKSLTLLCGPEASFKSSFSCICAANAQKEGYQVLLFDTEGAWSDDFAKRWGLDPEKIIVVNTLLVDDISVIMGNLIKGDDEKLFIILDSLGGLESEKLMNDAEKGDIKADQGQLQKKIKQMLKLFLGVVKYKKSIGVFTGHLYGNPSGYGAAEEVGGGKFAKLCPDIIIQLKKAKSLDKDKNVIGNLINALTVKNRFYPAFNECTVDINYRDGINKKVGMVDIASRAGFISKAGAGWMTNTVTGEKIQGEAKAEEWIDDEMLIKLNEFLKETGYSTINETAKVKLEEVFEPEFIEEEIV